MKDFDTLYDELVLISRELRPYYSVDKVKSYSVYVWNLGDIEDDDHENIFDIMADEIVFYKKHEIVEDAKPIIEKIQSKLKEMNVMVR